MPQLHHNRLHVHLTPLLLTAFIITAVAVAGVVSGLGGSSRFAVLGEALFKTPFNHQKVVTNAATVTPVDRQKPSGTPADATLLGQETAVDVQSQNEAVHPGLTQNETLKKPVQPSGRTGVYTFN